MKIIFCINLFLFSNIFLFSQAPFDNKGSGTKDDPYQIWTKKHLIELADSLPQNLADKRNWTMGKSFRLMADINNVTRCIGGGYRFDCHFYGSGKKINIAMNNSGYSFASVGGFSSYKIASIDSLTVDGYFVNEGYTGICSAIMYDSYVSYCINNTDVSYAGITYGNYGTISYCLNNGSITGFDCVGGIVSMQEYNVLHCINTGKITATGNADNYDGAGGIAGISAPNNTTHCINIGSVEGIDKIGGITGHTYGHPYGDSELTNCSNYGFIKGVERVGGIAGINISKNTGTGTSITKCYNSGVVEGEKDTGGIVGKED